MPSANKAQTALAILKSAKARAQIALDPAVREAVPKTSWYASLDVAHKTHITTFPARNCRLRIDHERAAVVGRKLLILQAELKMIFARSWTFCFVSAQMLGVGG